MSVITQWCHASTCRKNLRVNVERSDSDIVLGSLRAFSYWLVFNWTVCLIVDGEWRFWDLFYEHM